MIEKSSLHDIIIAHFQALENQSMEVPGWGVTLWFSPVTPRERVRLNAIDDDIERNVAVIVEKARLEDGSRAFTAADKPWLMNETGANIVQLVAQRILTADLMDPKRLGKPSPPTGEASSTPATPSPKQPEEISTK